MVDSSWLSPRYIYDLLSTRYKLGVVTIGILCKTSHVYGIFGTMESNDVVMYLPQNEIATAQRYSNIFNVHLHIIPSSLCTNIM